MRAFIQEHLSQDGTKVALDFYTSALEVLQWGNVQWKDVSPEDKGATFKDSFVRGVKVLRLDAFLKVNQRRSFMRCAAPHFVRIGLYRKPWSGVQVSFVRSPGGRARPDERGCANSR